MQYREFGTTGKKISALGFGCMRLPEYEKDGKKYIDEENVIPMLQRAYKEGVNYFDTAHGYCSGNSQYTLGRAVKGMKREDVMIATKIPLWDVKETADYRRMLDEQLRRLDMEYIDFYHFHGLNKGGMDDKVKPLGLMKEARKAVDEGLIRHVSFSFHGNPDEMQYIIEQGEIFASVLLQYNLLDRSHEAAIAYLAEKGVGVVAMGPVAGGRLAAPSELGDRLIGEKNPETAEFAIRFVLGNRNVSCALAGMETDAMLTQNLKAARMEVPMTEADFNKAKQMMVDLRKLSELYCPGCKYCEPCPAGINISHIFNAYIHHSVYGMDTLAKSMYRQVSEAHKDWHGNLISETVSKCTECGSCEPKCPQNIKIIEKLKEVDKALAAL